MSASFTLFKNKKNPIIHDAEVSKITGDKRG
jgi:hypothetical protein